MTEDDLRKFDKEVLVQFIYADTVFSREATLAKLLHYERRFQFKKLTEKSRKLLDEMQTCECPVKFNSLYKSWQKVHRQMNKILGV